MIRRVSFLCLLFTMVMLQNSDQESDVWKTPTNESSSPCQNHAPKKRKREDSLIVQARKNLANNNDENKSLFNFDTEYFSDNESSLLDYVKNSCIKKNMRRNNLVTPSNKQKIHTIYCARTAIAHQKSQNAYDERRNILCAVYYR